jgi:histidinol-phosphate aminotransferase
MYEIYALATGATILSIPMGADFSFPLLALLKAINYKTRLICIANPNNPTGAAVDLDDLRMILRSAPQAAVLIDEAYYDFNGETMLVDLDAFDNLFVTRTFSKAYGLAGFRLGVLIGDVEQMKMVRRVGSPYNVNGVALECLKAALEDKAFVANYCAEVKQGRAQLEAFYNEHKIQCWPSRGNFVLAQFGDSHSAVTAELKRRGILVRDRNTDPGCAGCVRITLGSLEQTARLLRVLPEALVAAGFWKQSPTEAR